MERKELKVICDKTDLQYHIEDFTSGLGIITIYGGGIRCKRLQLYDDREKFNRAVNRIKGLLKKNDPKSYEFFKLNWN
jgi:hypothetical protein